MMIKLVVVKEQKKITRNLNQKKIVAKLKEFALVVILDNNFIKYEKV